MEFNDTILTAAVRMNNYSSCSPFSEFYKTYEHLKDTQNGYGCTPVFVALHLQKLHIAKFLLSKKVDILIENNRGNTIFNTLYHQLVDANTSPEYRAQIREMIKLMFTEYGYDATSDDRYRKYDSVIPVEYFNRSESLQKENKLLKLEIQSLQDENKLLKLEICELKSAVLDLFKR